MPLTNFYTQKFGGVENCPYNEISKQLKVTKNLLIPDVMKNAVMVATLCTAIVSSAFGQMSHVLREFLISDITLESVALYKVDTEADPDRDWDEYFSEPGRDKMNLMEVKNVDGPAFFDIEEPGVYAIASVSNGKRNNNTYIVVNQEYIDRILEEGWAVEHNGFASGHLFPLRIAREDVVFFHARGL